MAAAAGLKAVVAEPDLADVCTAAREGLRGSGLPWPEPGSDLFSRYLDQWTESALTTIRDFDGPSGGATP